MFDNAEIIYAYSRQQALEDGVLIDVTHLSQEAGIKYPVAVTAALWSELIEPDQLALDLGQSADGRLWDALFMFTVYARLCRSDRFEYPCLFTHGRKRREHKIKAICGPGDTVEPVITLMLPNED